jgi:hypothetical protein
LTLTPLQEECQLNGARKVTLDMNRLTLIFLILGPLKGLSVQIFQIQVNSLWQMMVST